MKVLPPPSPRILGKVSETLGLGPDLGGWVGGFLGGVGLGGVFWGWVLSSWAGWFQRGGGAELPPSSDLEAA